jgi:hypothetical protein
MTGVGRRARAAAMPALLAVLLLPSQASAALFLLFDPPSGPPGTDVRARTAGEQAFAALPAAADFPTIFVKAGGRSVTLGRLQIDAGGTGTITFMVPEISAGTYTVLAKLNEQHRQALMEKCPTCGLLPGQELDVGRFVVERPAVRTGLDSTVVLIVGGVVAVIALSGAILARGRRRLSSAPSNET